MACKAHILTYFEILLTAENAEFAEERLKSEISAVSLGRARDGVCGLHGEKYRPIILIKLCKTKPIFWKIKWM